MGWDSGVKALKAVANARTVVAIEALVAAQALDLRAPLEPSRAASAARDVIRSAVDAMMTDRVLAPQIDAVVSLIPEIVDAAAGKVDGLL